MRRLVLSAAAVVCLAGSATPARAENDYGEDTRLKGRGAGRGVALFYNNLDKPSKRAINIAVIVFIFGVGAWGVARFVRQTRESLAPRPREPWEAN